MTLIAGCLIAAALMLGLAFLMLSKWDRDHGLKGKPIPHPDDMNPFALDRIY